MNNRVIKQQEVALVAPCYRGGHKCKVTIDGSIYHETQTLCVSLVEYYARCRTSIKQCAKETLLQLQRFCSFKFYRSYLLTDGQPGLVM